MATANRPLLIGEASGPSPPYPLRMSGTVISGFGRGSKELGIPTANLPVDDAQTPWISSIPSGVYFGWAALRLPSTHPDYLPPQPDPVQEAEANDKPPFKEPKFTASLSAAATKLGSAVNGYAVHPMVMSIGYNPFYKNTVRSAEVHVLHDFAADFYGVEMRLLLAGFIREERDYANLAELIDDIRFDCDVARRSLARDAWAPKGVPCVQVDEGEEEGPKKRRWLQGRLEAEWLVGREEEVVAGEGR